MAKRIDAETDMQILSEIGLGIPNKVIAERYGVSASYVSKIKTGRKVIDVYVPIPEKLQSNGLEVYEQPLEELIDTILKLPVITDEADIIKQLKEERIKAALRVKILTEILNKLKGE